MNNIYNRIIYYTYADEETQQLKIVRQVTKSIKTNYYIYIRARDKIACFRVHSRDVVTSADFFHSKKFSFLATTNSCAEFQYACSIDKYNNSRIP